MNFKYHINNHFAGCHVLGLAKDEHRNRDVKVFALPGVFDVVGVFDGTDAWIAPVIADPFNIDIKKRLEDYAAGRPPRLRRMPPPEVTEQAIEQPKRRERRAVPTGF